MSAPTSSEDRPRKRRPYAPRVPLAERREQLLDAALAVIVSDGYDRISIDAIAKRAHVARSVVYGAFENLDALLTALLDRQQARAFARLLETIPGPGDPRGPAAGDSRAPDAADPHDPAAFASEAVRRMSAMLREDPDTWRLILLTPGNMPSVVRDRIESDRERFRFRVEGWISLVLTDRSGPELDPRVLAHALVACAEHFGRVALTDPGAFEPSHLVGQVRVILGALWPPTR
ncbi:TetR/AcrR family transcriptional regulator [Streptomyces europaeiscabiei]|uniref:Helix-turn-helix domain containing protein n=1 Tax=Streptomyces europaeiscabiei TaxID=146819 RepID=A0ABU4NV39_9ACTN|nr:TetR/AcrR family transcriptional regulator [Streptomyces europaeiscabiei]MDX3549451.1 helix-turn-helix domain containing protein [Streptomyces europaeiscabiei]MDX3558525.1 helix-turn-helix domain containing protein [Streptomyces europaeiscabiei]MDX3670669.1 helix-turn-helix domain containing protein [Streptomyces europaeiscabiei]MDX3706470.1 helix-turn-helix domain containing protein [Streptomyces europaeiscabiei]MDX3783967.1 helix-turn-helix domain containing protein [Streptomyces europaei